jgi:virginiamycin A acetyltransferase
MEGQARIVFLRPLVVDSPKVSVGEYTYYDDPDRPEEFEQHSVLYAYGPARLEIGRY